jgi:transcriptional repressor NrdR
VATPTRKSKDSRPAEDHGVDPAAGGFARPAAGRFTTYERVQLRDLVVVKIQRAARGL